MLKLIPKIIKLYTLVKTNDKKIVISFFFLDLLAISLASTFSIFFRFTDSSDRQNSKIGVFNYSTIVFLVAVMWILYLTVNGSYRLIQTNTVALKIRDVVKSTIEFFFALGFLSFSLKLSFSRAIYLIMFIGGILFIIFFRIVFFIFFIKPAIHNKKIGSEIMIVGRDLKQVSIYSDWIIANRKFGFKVVSRNVCTEINSKWLEDFDRLLVYNKIEEILFLPGIEVDPNFSKFINYCEDLKLHVNWIPLESGNMGYWLIPSQQEGIPFLTFEQNKITLPWKVTKRLFDLVFSISLMILLSPLFLLISLAVLFSSGWPIFYSQTRIGYQGRKFKFYKFRSMIKDADKIVDSVENMHQEDHVLFKNRIDPRVTPVGRFLRKYSLDELPQFLNVLNNTMSVVGPRPALPKEVYAYNSIYERRLNAKPGITGPWQISGRSDLDLGTSVSLDLNYLTNWSFSRDLWIIFATIGVIFKGKGAY